MPAKVASNLVVQDVTNVLAMTYESMVSAVPLFFEIFYQCFFLRGMSFSYVASIGCHSLGRHVKRTASFGLTVGLPDWPVPADYTAGQNARFSYETTDVPKRALRDFYGEVIEPKTSTRDISVIPS